MNMVKNQVTQRKKLRKGGITVVLLTLLSAGMMLPVLGQTKAQAKAPSDKVQSEGVERVAESSLDADLERSISQFISAETSYLSPAEQQALQLLLPLKLEDKTLASLSTLSSTALHAQLKQDAKFSHKFSQLPTDVTSLKFSPAVFAAARLAGHMRSIGKAALLGNVVGAIRAADFDFSAMFSALSTGDIEEFGSLLSEALPRQTTFVEAISTGATFACNNATIDLTPDLCSRFSKFMRSTITRYQR